MIGKLLIQALVKKISRIVVRPTQAHRWTRAVHLRNRKTSDAEGIVNPEMSLLVVS
jgi:hypothetical protein